MISSGVMMIASIIFAYYGKFTVALNSKTSKEETIKILSL